MAAVIESVTNQASYTAVTDVGSSGTFTVTKPTGLTVGEVLLVATSVNTGSCTPPAGWSTGTIPNDFSSRTDYFYKVADAGDVAASNYTFATSSDSADYMYACYRLSGVATSISPVIETRTGDTDDTPTSASVTFSSSITPPDGTVVLIFIGIDSQTTAGSTASISGYALTGGSVTFTERFDDNDVGGTEDGAAIADGVLATSATITGATFTASGSKTPPTEFLVNVLFIYPQQDASATLTLTTTGNTAFAPTGQAGATATLTTTETTNEAFAPTGRGTSDTNWTNPTKPSTDWTNKTI